MFEVNWCWACDSCGRVREFADKHEAIAYFKTIRPYCSHIHFGKLPEGVGVKHFENSRCEHKGKFGSYKLANMIKELFYNKEEK